VNIDQLLWLTSRTAALTAFVVLVAAIVTGQALRTSLLDGWVRKRAVADLHQFLTVCWLPLVALHVAAVTLDSVSRLSWLDVFVPFRSSYAALPIGLGTCGFDLLIVVAATGYLREKISPPTWLWLHRMSYLMCALFGLHALLAGTDVARPVVAAGFWALLAFTAVLTLARLIVGRLAVPAAR
jgi:DMSO/TMAO reductase YedYZ heme-binding membrane subunit